MYTEVTKKVNQVIERRAGELSLVSDGWTNVRREGIINYTLVSRTDAIFIKSVHTNINRHNGEYIADGLLEVINQIGPDRIVAVTTDNASNMTSSWERLRSVYPKIACIGCGSHMTNLLVEDIAKIPSFHTHLDLIKEVNKWWKSSSINSDHLRAVARLHGKKAIALQLPGKTRWQGKLYTCRSAFNNKDFMMQAILDRNTCLGDRPKKEVQEKYERMREIILDENFWIKTLDMVTLLEPYLKVTIAMESNQSKLSRLYAWFVWLLANTWTMKSCFLSRVQAEKLISERFYKLYNPLWLIAYLCDPVVRQQRPVNISQHQMNDLGPFLKQWFHHRGETTNEKATLVFGQLRELKEREGMFADEMIWQTAITIQDIAVWWKSSFSNASGLVQLAVYALSISPTSGAAERNWSAFGYIHCMRRNRLDTARVDKLVFLYWNLRMLRNIPDYGPIVQIASDGATDTDELAMEGDIDDGDGDEHTMRPDFMIHHGIDAELDTEGAVEEAE
jgi:hypothetical protein